MFPRGSARRIPASTARHASSRMDKTRDFTCMGPTAPSSLSSQPSVSSSFLYPSRELRPPWPIYDSRPRWTRPPLLPLHLRCCMSCAAAATNLVADSGCTASSSSHGSSSWTLSLPILFLPVMHCLPACCCLAAAYRCCPPLIARSSGASQRHNLQATDARWFK